LEILQFQQTTKTPAFKKSKQNKSPKEQKNPIIKDHPQLLTLGSSGKCPSKQHLLVA